VNVIKSHSSLQRLGLWLSGGELALYAALGLIPSTTKECSKQYAREQLAFKKKILELLSIFNFSLRKIRNKLTSADI
jgi:hypothetical protein